MRECVREAAKLLPHQPVLDHFVHHNPLEEFQAAPFDVTLAHVHHLEDYHSPGERASMALGLDLRKRVGDALADVGSAFLDRDAAKWRAPGRHRGFLRFFASLEGLGLALWRAYARTAAARINKNSCEDTQALAAEILRDNLVFFDMPVSDWQHAVRAMLLELRGWAGMFRRIESHPGEGPPEAPVTLLEFAAVQSILMRSSLLQGVGQEDALRSVLQRVPAWQHQRDANEAPRHPSAIANLNQTSAQRQVLEEEFERTLVHAIGTRTERPLDPHPESQVYMCIDDRACSLRRHVEELGQGHTETFGVAGFFGLPIQYRPADGSSQVILAPEGQNPAAILMENECPGERAMNEAYTQRRRLVGRFRWWWETASFSPVGSLALALFAPVSAARLLLLGYLPATLHRAQEALMRVALPRPHTDFDLPFSTKHAATLLASTFRVIGTHNRFAPLVVVLGHGASSVNNPYSAAYNCGACSGREGGPNARLLARLANVSMVRQHLRTDHGIDIPSTTWFVGGMHNTTADTVELFDLDRVPATHSERVEAMRTTLQRACGINALERCQRFLLANHVTTPEQALAHVKQRATDAGEVRPELNHASNAAVVIGRRQLTAGIFLDRRVFLPSYDPQSDDENGSNLEKVMAPALVVCSGINLEYLFSTMDVEHHGSGSKAPLNVVGNMAVLQGTSGDLRPGLPSQMTEMHTPIRALFVVDAPVARVEQVLARREELRHLVRNEWVRLVVRDPSTGRFYRQTQGNYEPVQVDSDSADFVSFVPHREHAQRVSRAESAVYSVAAVSMLAACAVPVAMYGDVSMSEHGALIAMCATGLSLPVLSFSRRYLHGEFMFSRIAMLSTALVTGFTLVAVAPSLEVAMGGWSLFGLASTFLIGSYNERPTGTRRECMRAFVCVFFFVFFLSPSLSTVRNNATFAFAAYRVSDFALLVAVAHLHNMPADAALATDPAVAGGLLLAALFKSSQIPLTSLFVRSMEGPTPASALGYAGLSAHLGVVLLANTMPYWFVFDWARLTMGAVGLSTAAYGTLVSRVRADRKGAIASATSATLGLIFTVLALGYPQVALLASLGHASFRMIQILRAPSALHDFASLRSVLGNRVDSRVVPEWLYRLAWRLRRVDSDFHLLHTLHRLSRLVAQRRDMRLNKWQQWLLTSASVVLAGFPWTPLSDAAEHALLELIPSNPWASAALMAAHFGASVILIRFLFVNVLKTSRFFGPSTKK